MREQRNPLATHQPNDRTGRTVAEAYRNGQSVGLSLVCEGYAVVYRRYLNSCAETESEYLAAEEQAKVQRLNYWSQEAIVVPWDFRRGRGVGGVGKGEMKGFSLSRLDSKD